MEENKNVVIEDIEFWYQEKSLLIVFWHFRFRNFRCAKIHDLKVRCVEDQNNTRIRKLEVIHREQKRQNFDMKTGFCQKLSINFLIIFPKKDLKPPVLSVTTKMLFFLKKYKN